LLGDPELTVRKRRVLGLKLPWVITNLVNGVGILLQQERETPIIGGLVQVTLADGRRTNGFTKLNGAFEIPGVRSAEILSVSIHADGYAGELVNLQAPPPLIQPDLSFSPTEGFKFRVRGPRIAYLIQVSADLREWRTLQTVTGDDFEVTDTESSRETLLFYRVIPAP
jgi:hypothetical protein